MVIAALWAGLRSHVSVTVEIDINILSPPGEVSDAHNSFRSGYQFGGQCLSVLTQYCFLWCLVFSCQEDNYECV